MMRYLRLSSDSLWRNPTFVLFWSGRSISRFGSVITTVVLPILVYRLTNSALQTSLLAVLEVLPYLLFGLFAGVLADRCNRKHLMVLCDLTNTLLLASIPLAATFHVLTIAHIYLVALLSAVVFVWFDAANFGAIPALVEREHIITANSYLWSTETLLWIIGPSLAGALAAMLNPAFLISFDALSFAVSAVTLTLIPRTFNATHSREPVKEPLVRQTFTDIREGLHFLLHQPLVRTMTLLGFGNSFTGGAVIGLLVVYGVRVLNFSKTDARLGLLFTAGALGSLLASLLLPHLIKHVPVGRITLVTLSLSPLFLFGMAMASHMIVGMFCYGLWDACYSLIIINGIALRQMVTPDHLLSRVNATARMVAWGGTPSGAALGGILAETTSIRYTYMLMGLGVLISALVGWFSPLRKGGAV